MVVVENWTATTLAKFSDLEALAELARGMFGEDNVTEPNHQCSYFFIDKGKEKSRKHHFSIDNYSISVENKRDMAAAKLFAQRAEEMIKGYWDQIDPENAPVSFEYRVRIDYSERIIKKLMQSA